MIRMNELKAEMGVTSLSHVEQVTAGLIMARDVMRRTQQEMSKMKKTQEYDIPMYVS